MITRLINWLKGNAAADTGRSAQPRRSATAKAPPLARATPSTPPGRKPHRREPGRGLEGHIANADPGKNVRARTGDAIRDASALKILELSGNPTLDSEEPTGIDPYNSGKFDRSRQWDTRFRK